MTGESQRARKILFRMNLLVAVMVLFSQGMVRASTPELEEKGVSPYKDYSSFFTHEKIDTFNGNVHMEFPLFVLPQNGGWNLTIALTRNSKIFVKAPTDGGSGDLEKKLTAPGGTWDLHMGRIERKKDAGNQYYYIVEMPDGSKHMFYAAGGAWRSKENWLMTVTATTAVVRLTDGMKYTFTLNTSIDALVVTGQVTRIEDTYGNAVVVEYEGAVCCKDPECGTNDAIIALKKITDSCGRIVEFKNTTVKQATGEGQQGRFYVERVTGKEGLKEICAYEFSYDFFPRAGFSLNQLKSLRCVQGDLTWKFRYINAPTASEDQHDPEYPLCSILKELIEVTTPSLATISYAYETLPLLVGFSLGAPTYDYTRVVKKKTVDGYQNDVAQAVWTYSYSFSDVFTNGSIINITTVDCPMGKKEIYKYTPFASGDSYKSETLISKAIYGGSAFFQSEEYQWKDHAIATTGGPYCQVYPYRRGIHMPVLGSLQVKRGASGDKLYTTAYSNPDPYGRPGTIKETGDATRTTTKVYWSNPGLNLIDDKFIKSETVDVDGETYANTYEYYTLGKISLKNLSGVASSYKYDAKGNLSETQDGNGNETLCWNYSYSHPRDISYGTRNDGASRLPEYYTEHREYSWHGNVLSFQDGESHTTKYYYDGMGRLTTVEQPTGAQTFITDTIKYAPHGAYIQTLKSGNGTIYDRSYQLFNSLGQLSGTYDPDNNACIDIQYDLLGRKTFESYPYVGVKSVTDRVPTN